MWDFAFSGLRRRAAAMWERRPAPAARGMANTACTKDCIPLFPGRVSVPLHPLDGRETAIAPAERARSAQRRSCGMQFASRTRTTKPWARAERAARLRCADPHSFRRQESKLHSEVAGASRASGKAEVCGPACLKTAKTQNTPVDCGVDCFGPSAACCIRRSEQAMRRVPPGWCIRCFRQSVRTVRHPRCFT